MQLAFKIFIICVVGVCAGFPVESRGGDEDMERIEGSGEYFWSNLKKNSPKNSCECSEKKKRSTSSRTYIRGSRLPSPQQRDRLLRRPQQQQQQQRPLQNPPQDKIPYTDRFLILGP